MDFFTYFNRNDPKALLNNIQLDKLVVAKEIYYYKDNTKLRTCNYATCDYDSFWNYYIKLSPEDRVFYEMVPENFNRKFYIDTDITSDNYKYYSTFDGESFINEVILKINLVFDFTHILSTNIDYSHRKNSGFRKQRSSSICHGCDSFQ